MNLDDIAVDDRIEIYSPGTGTYWGYVTAIGTDHVAVDDLGPDNGQPTTIDPATITRIVHHGRRPASHVGAWRGVGR